MGVAYGYANIGMIGFEGRRDYTALGPVVNLASRLCAEASDGEILIDLQAHAAAADAIAVGEPKDLTIKGFAQPVTVYGVESVRTGIVAPIDEPAAEPREAAGRLSRRRRRRVRCRSARRCAAP